MTPCNQPGIFEIFVGQDKTMSMRCIFEDTGNPLDLTSCTEIVVSLPKKDGTQLQLKLSLAQVVITSPAVLGNFTVPISNVNSALLNVGTMQNVLVAFTISSLVTIVKFCGALSVLEAA